MTESDKARKFGKIHDTSVVLFSDEFLEALDDQLETLLQESKAKCAMVIDRTGVILSSVGDFHPLSHDNMGAMAAGVVAALNAMVSRASSPEVSVKLYGAEIDKIHFLVVADRLILCMLNNRHVTSGQTRQAAKNFSAAIMPAIDKERSAANSPGEGTTELLKSVQFIESKLNEMFLEHH